MATAAGDPDRPAAAYPVTAPRAVLDELDRLEEEGLIERPGRPLRAGEHPNPIPLPGPTLARLFVQAALRTLDVAPDENGTTEVIWSEGGDELAVDPGNVTIETVDGAVAVTVPVRCDETGPATTEVVFVVGSRDRPAGMFAATEDRPRGPTIVVDRWGDALTAFAWSAVLDVAIGVSAGAGRDDNGEPLIPGALTATADGVEIVPFARPRLGPLTP